MKGAIYETKIRGKVYYTVRFGRNITKNFKQLADAERFLNGLRYETDRGTFDPRDYRRDMPLAFSVLADRWLALKQKKVKPSSWKPLKLYISKAVKAWGGTNIKAIRFGDIEDFLYGLECSDKTRSNIRSCLHDFWRWVCDREDLPMPKFPRCRFELGYRKLISIEDQQRVLDTLHDIAPYKTWLACRFLSTYINVRPSELCAIRESDIHLSPGFISIPRPKEKKPKFVHLSEDDIDLLRHMPRGFPDLHFFRHDDTANQNAGKKYGINHLNNWWKRACKLCGIEGVPLYPGTRHSTVTALGDLLTPEQIKAGTDHSTNQAFERYFQKGVREHLVVVRAVKQHVNNHRPPSETAKLLNFQRKDGVSDGT